MYLSRYRFSGVALAVLLFGAHYGFAERSKKAEAEFFLQKGVECQNKYRMAGENGGHYLEEAVAAYKQALYVDPDCVAAYWRLDDCYLVLGDFDNYMKTLSVLKKLDTTARGQAEVLLRLGCQKEGAEKAVLFERSLQTFADDTQATFERYLLTARVYRDEVKNGDKCRAYCSQALALNDRLRKKEAIDALQHFNNQLNIYRDYLDDYGKVKEIFDTFLTTEKDEEFRSKVENLLIYHRKLWSRDETGDQMTAEERMHNAVKEFEQSVAAHNYDPMKLYVPPHVELFRHYIGRGEIVRGMAIYDAAHRSFPFMNNTLVTMPVSPDDRDVFRKAFKAAGRWDLFFLQVKSYLDFHGDFISVNTFLEGVTGSYRAYLSRPGFTGRSSAKTVEDRDEWAVIIRGKDLECRSINTAEQESGEGDTLFLGTDTGTRNTWRILMKAKLPKLPARNVIRAKLFMYSKPGGQFSWSSSRDIVAPFVLHEVAAPWDVLSAGWREKIPGKKWRSSGGDIAQMPLYMENVNYNGITCHCIYTFDVTAMMRRWLSGGSNYGIALKELDEMNIFPRQPSRLSMGTAESSPQLVLFVASKKRPALENVVKYNGDWKYYYFKGLDALAEEDVERAEFYWEKAQACPSFAQDAIAGHIRLLRENKVPK